MLHEDVGTQFLALQGTGAAISQRVSGLAPGSVYEVRLLAANRPGYGGDSPAELVWVQGTVDG